jgi:hypothetical protein
MVDFIEEAPALQGDLDSDSGPYLLLMAAAIKLARSDLDNPVYSEDATLFLSGELVHTFSEAIGYGGDFFGRR